MTSSRSTTNPTVTRRSPIVLLALLAGVTSVLAQPREEDRRYKLGEGYERAGDMRGAARIYRELYDADSQSDLYFQAVRRTYSALGLNAELLPIVEARVAARPNDFELRVTFADLLYRAGRRDEARAEWKRALDNGNYQEFTFALVAQSQTDVRAFDAAIETYRAARERSGDRFLFGDQLAFLHTALGQFEEATREYLAILGADPERLQIVKRSMAAMTSNPTGLAAATRTVEAAVERNPDFEPSLELLSWLYDEGQNYTGAFDVAKRLDHARGGKGSSIYAYADRALRERRYDAALTALDYFMATYDRTNPLYSTALLTYARTLEERHRSGAAGTSAAELVEHYTELADREEGTEVAAEALLRAARIQAEDLDAPAEAASTLEELITSSGNAHVLAEAYLLLGELRVRADALDEARSFYERAIAAAEGSDDGFAIADEARLRRAEILLYRGEFKAAVDSLTELTRHTTSSATNDALGYLFMLQENFERNDAALGDFMAAKLAVVQHRWKDAEARFDAAIAAAPRTTLAEEATLARADVMSTSGEHAAAADALIAFVAASPEALAADRALYRAAEIVDRNLHDAARALALYTRLLTEYPKSQHTSVARVRVRELRNG
jgi:tetratricopeptide (TPR) repeat protein